MLNYSALNALADFTVEYWIYNQGANANKSVGQIGTASQLFFRDGFDGGGTNSMNDGVEYTGNEAFAGVTQGGIRASNTWEHNALVFNSSTKLLSIYKNGVLKSANFFQVGSGTQQSSTGADVYLAVTKAIASFANIRLACWRMWNIQRSALQLVTYMNYYLNPPYEIGLIADLDFIEGTGTTVGNSVTGGNNLLLTGAPSWATGPALTAWVYPVRPVFSGTRTQAPIAAVGTALQFNGTTQYVSSASNPSTVTNNFTLTFIAKILSYPSSSVATLVCNGYDVGASAGYYAYIDTTGKLTVSFSGVTTISTAVILLLNTPYRFHIVRNNGTTQIYINGINIGVSTTSTPIAPGKFMTVGCRLHNDNTVGEFVNAIIDDVAIYEIPFDQQLIINHVNGINLVCQSPKLWWRFNEGSGSNAADSGTSGVAGTLQNSPAWVTGFVSSVANVRGQAIF